MVKFLAAGILVALLLPISAWAQASDSTDRLDKRVAELKEALNLSDEQADQLYKIFEEARPTRQGEHGVAQANENGQRGDPRARWSEINGKIQSVLTDKQWEKYQDYEQKRRMNSQLESLTEAVHLTDKQVVQVQTIMEYYQGRMEEMFSDQSGGDAQDMRKVMQKLRDAEDQEIKDVLTEDQRDLYDKYQNDRREQMRNRRPGGGMGPGETH